MQTEHQKHFRGPASEPFHRREPVDDLIVGQHVELVEPQPPVRDPGAQIAEIRTFLAAEADAAKLFAGEHVNRRRARNLGVGKQRDEASENRRRRFRRELLAHDRADERREMIFPLPRRQPARPDALDHAAENWVAAHQQPTRARVVGRRHAVEATRKPMLCA